jgi:hypothetical protein
LIKNKAIAIVLAVLTFIVGSILLIWIIFYLAKIPLSSIWEGQNQLYVFTAILASAILASMVYGRGSKQRASDVTKFLNESLELELKEKDVYGWLRKFERIPTFVVNLYISMNINVVKEFEGQMEENYGHLTDESILKIKKVMNELTDEDLLKIRKILEMPVPELQNLLNELYLITNIEQFKILAEPKAEPLIELNVEELKRILFND